MKTYTIDEIKEAMTMTDQREAIQEAAEAFRSHMTPDTTDALLEAIIDNLRKHEATPQGKADTAGWSRLDRISWIVKEAFIAGETDGYCIACNVFEDALQEMQQEGTAI